MHPILYRLYNIVYLSDYQLKLSSAHMLVQYLAQGRHILHNRFSLFCGIIFNSVPWNYFRMRKYFWMKFRWTKTWCSKNALWCGKTFGDVVLMKFFLKSYNNIHDFIHSVERCLTFTWARNKFLISESPRRAVKGLKSLVLTSPFKQRKIKITKCPNSFMSIQRSCLGHPACRGISD